MLSHMLSEPTYKSLIHHVARVRTQNLVILSTINRGSEVGTRNQPDYTTMK